ncbi:MAG TPA: hypothetical protein VGL20_04990 [Candidatus Dormibacteraeota bacterium]
MGLAASSLTLVAALGLATTDVPRSIGNSAPGSLRPAIEPLDGGGAGPRPRLKVPGGIAGAGGAGGPQARFLGDAASRARGLQATRPGNTAGRGAVSDAPATRPGDTSVGGTVPGSQATPPGDSAAGGTVVGAQLTLLGMAIAAQTTLR